MQIVIELNSLRDIRRFIYDIYEKYRHKIKNVKKTTSTIELINGDYIKFISNANTADGIRADVAIGSHADILTIASNQEKRIWDFEDLENHLKNI